MNENIIENNEIKENKKFKIPLIIIAILIILLISFGVVTYFISKKDASPINVYYQTIDEFESGLTRVVDETNRYFTNLIGTTGNIKFNINSNDDDINIIREIINNLTINYNNEMNYQNALASTILTIDYKNEQLPNINLMLKNNDIFIDLNTYFNKIIRLNDDSLNNIWNINYTNDLKTIIKNLTLIIKDNLKEEYFKKDKTDIMINGKETSVTNYELNIKKKELNNFKDRVLNSILNDDSLIKAIANVTKKDINELKNQIKNNIQNLKLDYDLKMNVYLDKNNKLEKIILEENSTLIIERKNNNVYEITIKENDNVNNLGTITIKGTTYEFDITVNDTKISGSITNKSIKYDFDITLTYDDNTYTISNKTNNDHGEFLINYKKLETDFNINITYDFKDITEVKEIDTSNYINYSELKSEDIQTILMNYASNDALKLLMEDLSKININNVDEEFGSGTEEIPSLCEDEDNCI